jgi:uncharacterized protein
VLTARVALVTLAASAWGYDFSALKQEGHLSDFARVAGASTKTQVNGYCEEIERATGVRLVLTTLPSLQGEPIDDVAGVLFRKWGVGQHAGNQGVLVLFAIRERRIKIQPSAAMAAILPEDSAGDLLGAMKPALKPGHFGDALILAVREAGARIEKAKGVKIAGAPTPSRAMAGESAYSTAALGALVSAAVGAMLFWIARRRQPRNIAAGCRPCRGIGTVHGGFGGCDSGDSAGAFDGAPAGKGHSAGW